MQLSAADERWLLDLAERALRRALGEGAPPDPGDRADIADVRCGAFVTLEVDGDLNGCIGSLDGEGPLRDEIPRLALAAAFDDPRLPPLRRHDLPHLAIEVSLLSPMEPVRAGRRSEVIDALAPGTDGLLLAAGRHRAVFLPDVWQQLPDPDDFVDHLLAKAGLSPGSWPPGMRAWRFRTTAIRRALDG